MITDATEAVPESGNSLFFIPRSLRGFLNKNYRSNHKQRYTVDGLIGKKIGMTSIYDGTGKNVACTIIEAGPCVVTQVLNQDGDGYDALQLSYGERKPKNTPAALRGHFERAGTAPKRKVLEFRDMKLSKNLGDLVTVSEVFAEGDKINVIGISKGKGFQGVVKRHGFGGVMQQTHGQHNRLRAPGSLGNSSFAAKVMKGMRMAGHMGAETVKLRRLKVLKVFPEQNLILVKGAVPGHKGSLVVLEK
jgi:large subunit ribosomal protein L3